MNTPTIAPRAPELDHEFARENLPWAANGTLDELGMRRVAEHAEHCDECRTALAQQRTFAAVLQASPVVELAPQPGLANLMKRIEKREARRSFFARLLRPLEGESGALAGVRGLRPLAFTVAIQALVIVGLTAVLITAMRPSTTAQFTTLSTAPAATATTGQLRVVLDGELTLTQISGLLEPLHARIVDGPRLSGNGFGVVTVAIDGDSQVALHALRTQQGVKLAELVSP